MIAVQGFAIDFKIEPNQRSWTTWNSTHSCLIESLYLPTTRDELTALLQEAHTLGKKVKVIGSGHSLNAIALPDQEGWTVSLERYAKILAVDVESRTITVQGGATLHQINAALDQHGLALANLGSISDQTIGGVIQTGTHGTGKNHGPLHTQIAAMTVINGKGECKTLSPDQTPHLFQAYLCGLGTLGVIDTVTLRAVPARNLEQQTAPAQWPELLDRIGELVQINEHFRFYWFPYCNRSGVWTANSTMKEVQAIPQNPAPFDRLIDETAKQHPDQSFHSIEDVLELGPDDPAVMERFNLAFFETDYENASVRVDRSDRIFNVDCSAHSHCCALETSFPIRYTKPFLLKLQTLVEENHFPVHGGVEVRFVRADQALISPTYSENPDDLFCFVSLVSIRPNLLPISYEPLFQAFQTLAESCQGRLHWGKMGRFDPAYLKDAYPHWELFKELQKQEDPSGMFLNAFTKKIFDRTL